jgi:carnosine N-methyltransferase
MASEEHEEAEHFAQVFRSFQTYAENSLSLIHRRKLDLDRIRPEHCALLKEKTGFHDRFKKAGAAVVKNQQFINMILQSASGFMNPIMESMLNEENKSKIYVSEMNKDKVRSTLKQCVRDWTAEGEAERKECYDPILSVLKKQFPNDRSNVRVLVPGAGLGRLAWEIARLGFETQGNEFSYFMLLASNYILNK